VTLQCKILGVSKSGYYDWRSRPESKRDRRNKALLEKLKQSFDNSHKTYGVIRLTEDLNASGENVNHKRIARLKRKHSIYPVQYKRYVVTTDSDHLMPIADNLLNREFTNREHNEVWVSDITYIPTEAGWAYLAVVIDLYSRMVIGWQLASHMRADLVCDAIRMSEIRRGSLPKMFHSDRGTQYASEDVANSLPGVTVSMSRRGNCWDNAVAESFFGSLKTELVDHAKYKNIGDTRQSLFQYIEGFYNQRRRHSFLGYVSPATFERNAA